MTCTHVCRPSVACTAAGKTVVVVVAAAAVVAAAVVVGFERWGGGERFYRRFSLCLVVVRFMGSFVAFASICSAISNFSSLR